MGWTRGDPNAPKAPGPMSPTAATEVAELWSLYYQSALTSSSVAGGLQLAIWEVVAGSINNDQYFSIDPGQDGPGQIAALASEAGKALELTDHLCRRPQGRRQSGTVSARP